MKDVVKETSSFVNRLEHSLSAQEAINSLSERLFNRYVEAIKSCHEVIEELIAEREGGPRIPDYEIGYIKQQLRQYKEQDDI